MTNNYEFIEISNELLYCEKLGLAITREALDSIDERTLQQLLEEADSELDQERSNAG